MDLQIYRLLEEDYTTDLFRSEFFHMKKNHTDLEFVTILIKYNFVEVYWNKKWYYKALYTLALLDYLSDEYNTPHYDKYDFYRTQKLERTVYPSGIILLDNLHPNDKIKDKVVSECKKNKFSRYFLKYNIIELEDDELWKLH